MKSLLLSPSGGVCETAADCSRETPYCCCREGGTTCPQKYCIRDFCEDVVTGCQVNWDIVTEIIDAGNLNVYYEWDTADFSDFPRGNSFRVFSSETDVTYSCGEIQSDCDPNTSCSGCTRGIFCVRYFLSFCYNDQCYRLYLYVPMWHVSGYNYRYYDLDDGITDVICDSYCNGVILDESDFKCDNDLCGSSHSAQIVACQQADEIQASDLPMVGYVVSSSPAGSCPCDCESGACQTNNCEPCNIAGTDYGVEGWTMRMTKNGVECDL